MAKVVQGCQGKHSRSRLYEDHSLARELYLSDTSGIVVSYWLLPFLDRSVSEQVISLRNLSRKVDTSTIRGKTGVITTYKNVVKTTKNYREKWL